MSANSKLKSASRSAYGPGQFLPIPPDFPIQWANPAQARRLWLLDRMHFPDPVPPLLASLREAVVEAPFNRAAAHYDLPIRLATLYANTYLYLSFNPTDLPPEAILKGLNLLRRVAPGLVRAIQTQAMAGGVRAYLARLEPVIERLGECWADEWLPELKAHLAYWETLELNRANMSGLLAYLDETLQRIARVWEVHFQIVFPSFLALSQFYDLYHDLFDDGEPQAAFGLLQGFDNSYLKADRALWQLSRQAMTLPRVRESLTTIPAAGVIAALAGSPEGQVFLAELRAFLAEYGQRGPGPMGLVERSWQEDPSPVIQRLQDYLSRPDRDLEAELKVQAAEREALTVRTRSRLKEYPPETVARFERLLLAAQIAVVLHEEHNYWIEQRCMVQARRVILACGCRLVEAGVISQPEDIFYLTLAEIREAGQGPPASAPLRTLIESRQAEVEHFRAVTPPPTIGALPLYELPDDPFGRSLSKVFGALIPADPRQDTNHGATLHGQAASPGLVRGQARVMRSLAEAERLQAGDILVTEATMPAWTPLFAITAAVVTEVGGILSHCAVIAREYGIPAVVAADRATQRIRDGQMIEVDGTAGTVRLLD